MLPGMMPVITGAASYEAEATALFARASVEPGSSDKAAINKAIRALKSANLLTKFDGFWCLGADTGQFAQRNWVQDLYNLVPVNAPTFMVKGGYKGNGSSSYLQFGASQNTLTKFTQNSAHMMVWALDLPTVTSESEIGIYSGTDRARIRFTNGLGGSGTPSHRINQSSTDDSANVSRGTGMLLSSRTGATAAALYHNDNEVDTFTTASAALTASPLGLLRGLASYSNARIVAASIGSGMTTSDKSALYSIVSTLLAELGVA